MKKILIIGSHGMAGHVIKKILLETDRFLIFDIARSDQYGKVSYQMDVTNFDKLIRIYFKIMFFRFARLSSILWFFNVVNKS